MLLISAPAVVYNCSDYNYDYNYDYNDDYNDDYKKNCLDHHNTTITNSNDIFENPECCKDETILKSWTGCCIDVMNGRDEETCDVPAKPDADVIDLIYSIVWCPSTMQTSESIADMPICCMHPLIHKIIPGASEECCKRFGLCSEKRRIRSLWKSI